MYYQCIINVFLNFFVHLMNCWNHLCYCWNHLCFGRQIFNQSFGKAQYINDGLSRKNSKCRIRGAPNGAKYCLAFALDDYPKDTEMDTTYDRDYWIRIAQWSKLSEEDKIVAAVEYAIKAPYDLI